MSTFRMSFHSLTARRVVEIWQDKEFIGVLYPEERGVKLISKHPLEVSITKSPTAGDGHEIDHLNQADIIIGKVENAEAK
jgi:predicted metalloprotease